MQRRWIVLGIFIGLLTLCITAWVWSGFYDEDLSYTWNDSRTPPGTTGIWVTLSHQRFYMCISYDEAGTPTGWQHAHGPPDENFLDVDVASSGAYGFRVRLAPRDHPEYGSFFTIPLWFPTAIAGVLLFFVWRKTRPPATAGAFTVET